MITNTQSTDTKYESRGLVSSYVLICSPDIPARIQTAEEVVERFVTACSRCHVGPSSAVTVTLPHPYSSDGPDWITCNNTNNQPDFNLLARITKRGKALMAGRRVGHPRIMTGDGNLQAHIKPWHKGSLTHNDRQGKGPRSRSLTYSFSNKTNAHFIGKEFSELLPLCPDLTMKTYTLLSPQKATRHFRRLS